MKRRMRIRSAAHLDRPRPVPAHRAVGGPIRLVFVDDRHEVIAAAAATLTGLIALGALAFGVAVLA
ncbi:hypothetical protein JNB62_05575 [Microbacterium jejuense]|uniref:Uncharacterized protein n=1 Tax=Microbacterium jejuense TaxID=1263637 RepID=A0ABS7HLJ5_9MICO|nr:hypothetical protein [Microbacterium jejuense]MBW9093146.1 hypothetical protein [Microbacterium jejuense]